MVLNPLDYTKRGGLIIFIAILQALAAIPSIDSEAVQQRLDHVRTYYELLNMPFEASHWNHGLLLWIILCAAMLISSLSPEFPGLASFHHRTWELVYTCRVSCDNPFIFLSLVRTHLISNQIKKLHWFCRYANLLKVNVLGREIPPDAQDRVSYILSH